MQQIKHLNEDNVRTILKWINLSASIDEKIDDLNIRSDAVFSSKKVSELAQEVKHSLEQYIQSSINGLTHLKKKIVDTLPSDADAEENILYLVKDASVVDDVVYNQYLLIDGKLEPLGNTSTDISNYYNKDESDAKFALLSNLQTLIDAIGELSTLQTTEKQNLVGAINEIKVNLDNYITKDAIVTVLDNTVTDEQVVSAKTLYNKFGKSIRKTGVDLNTITDAGEYFVFISTNAPYTESGGFGFLTVQYYDGTEFAPNYSWGATKCVVQTFIQYHNNQQYPVMMRKAFLRKEIDTEWQWGEWKELYTTKIADVSKTQLTISHDTYTFSGTVAYEVYDGICYVVLNDFACTTTTTANVNIATLPKAKIGHMGSFFRNTSNEKVGFVYIGAGATQLCVTITTPNVGGHYTFTYPVAEDWRP